MQNKFLLFFVAIIMFLGISCANKVQKPDVQPGVPQCMGYVSDYHGLLSRQQRVNMTILTAELSKDFGSEIVLLIISSTGNDSVEYYASKIVHAWGLRKKSFNKWVLILAAIDDRKLRVEVGEGLAGIVSGTVVRQVVNDIMIPSFSSGDYYDGIYRAMREIDRVVRER